MTMFKNSVGQLMESIAFPTISVSPSVSINSSQSNLSSSNNQTASVSFPCLSSNTGQTNLTQIAGLSSMEHLINSEAQVMANSLPTSLTTNAASLHSTKSGVIGWDKHSEKKGTNIFYH